LINTEDPAGSKDDAVARHPATGMVLLALVSILLFAAVITLRQRDKTELTAGAGGAAADPADLVLAYSTGTGIHLVTADGTALGRVTDGRDGNFQWSPDGSRIAFQREGDLTKVHVVDADGGNHRVLGEGLLPSWSPDGSMVAFHGMEGRVEVAPASGGRPRTVSTQGGQGYPISWSPDGTRLAYVGGREGIQLVVTNLDGPTRTLHPGPVGSPEWSRDGSQITFEHDGLRAIDSDGANERLVSASGTSGGMSPDGSKLVSLTSQHFRVTTTEGDLISVVDQPGPINSPVEWSPDASMFAFAAFDQSAGATSAIFVVSADGSGLRAVARDPMGAWGPQFRPGPVKRLPAPAPTEPIGQPLADSEGARRLCDTGGRTEAGESAVLVAAFESSRVEVAAWQEAREPASPFIGPGITPFVVEQPPITRIVVCYFDEPEIGWDRPEPLERLIVLATDAGVAPWGVGPKTVFPIARPSGRAATGFVGGIHASEPPPSTDEPVTFGFDTGAAFPPGTVYLGGWVVGDTLGMPSYAGEHFRTGSHHTILFSRFLDHGANRTLRVVDVLEFDVVEPAEWPNTDCSLDGRMMLDRTIVGLTSDTSAEAAQPRLAWDFDRATERIVPVDPRRVLCEIPHP
jgi:Tol biopolymer transport system component